MIVEALGGSLVPVEKVKLDLLGQWTAVKSKTKKNKQTKKRSAGFSDRNFRMWSHLG